MTRLIHAIAVIATLLALDARGQELCNVEYLCADWGPAMQLPTKKGEKPQFSETEEEIYFLKQLTFFTRKPLDTPDLMSGRKYRDIGKELSVWLCKMKPDGTGKTEIKELWHEPDSAINIQGQSTWQNVNGKMHKIVLSIRFGGRDMTGLWTVNLDGSELKRIIQPGVKPSHIRAVNHPSWTPDGQWIVFEEPVQSAPENLSQIYKCDAEGKNVARLTEGANGECPSVSPDGKQIAYIHWFKWASWLYLMNLDGTNRRAVPNPTNKQWGTYGGTYPAWSPDGESIFFIGISDTIVNPSNGKTLWNGGFTPDATGWPQWGKPGLIMLRACGIAFADVATKMSCILAACTTAECKHGSNSECRW